MTKQASTCTASSSEVLPGKYAALLRAGAAGLTVPRSLLLHQDDEVAVDEFVAAAPANSRFIVRSAVDAEDGAVHSLAGHFWSSGAVSADAVAATIATARMENQTVLQALGREESLPCLMVQEYVEHQLGGVLFWPWSFFSDYACLDYSDQGVRQVVEGRGQMAVIALSEQAVAPVPLPDAYHFLLPLLSGLCRDLQRVFAYAFDCEWAYSEATSQIVLLQVRPQTHAVGPLLTLPVGSQPQLPQGDWQFTALSESVGHLSPLAFSLLQQLYADSRPLLRALGCRANAVDFLHRLPDGAVLVDPAREQAFYAPGLWGGFWRGFREPGLKQQTAQVVQAEAAAEGDTAFSYARLAVLFRHWMLANLLSRGEGRSVPLLAHAYEVSWHQAQMPLQKPDTLDANDWASLGRMAQYLCLREWAKLKAGVALQRGQVFSDWDEFQRGAMEPDVLSRRQQEQARLAVYDHVASLHTEGQGGMRSLAAPAVKQGAAFVIRQPARHVGNIPAGCVLFAPYFDNAWVASIAELNGIVVGQGSALSHSAIVAREHGIPYCVLSPLDLEAVEPGRGVRLDAVRGRLVWGDAAPVEAASGKRLDHS